MGKEIGSITAASTLTKAELLHVIQGGNSRQTTVGALGAWVLAGSCATAGGSTGSWTYASDVANVDFTNLGSFNELMIHMRNVTASVSGVRIMTVSTDNGSTFRTTNGDYVNLVANGVESNSTAAAGFGTSSSAAARSGIVRIPQSGLSGIIKAIENVTFASAALFVQSTLPITALRFNNSTGGNFTGGSILVLGR